MRDIHRIVDRIDQILKNERNQPLDMLGSYIVGETIIQDDYGEIQKKYPLLEKIAELSSDLETLGGSKYATRVHQEIIETLSQLKRELS